MDRRSQILDAAARLMGERGYRQTSVDDVIRAAGLAGKAHFYHYFKSKQELGYEVLDRQFDRFAERGLAILREPMIEPLDRLHLFIDSLVALQVTQGARSGSPFGNLAGELADSDGGFPRAAGDGVRPLDRAIAVAALGDAGAVDPRHRRTAAVALHRRDARGRDDDGAGEPGIPACCPASPPTCSGSSACTCGHSPGETGTAPAFAGSSGTAREK